MTTVLPRALQIVDIVGGTLFVILFGLHALQHRREWRKRAAEGDSQPAIAVMLGVIIALLAVTAGERLASDSAVNEKLSASDDRVAALTKQLSAATGGRLLTSTPAIYLSAAQLCEAAENHIRVVIVSNGTKAPDYFIAAVAQRMRDRRAAGHDVRYEVVLILSGSDVHDLDEFDRKMHQRQSTFDAAGVGDDVAVRIVDTPYQVGFDVLVVDKKHVQVGFPAFTPDRRLEEAIVFEDHADLAETVANWYDETVFPTAVPLESWLAQQRERRTGVTPGR